MDEDLGAGLSSAILDATEVTDRVVVDGELLYSMSEFDVQISRDTAPRFDHRRR